MSFFAKFTFLKYQNQGNFWVKKWVSAPVCSVQKVDFFFILTISRNWGALCSKGQRGLCQGRRWRKWGCCIGKQIKDKSRGNYFIRNFYVVRLAIQHFCDANLCLHQEQGKGGWDDGSQLRKVEGNGGEARLNILKNHEINCIFKNFLSSHLYCIFQSIFALNKSFFIFIDTRNDVHSL